MEMLTEIIAAKLLEFGTEKVCEKVLSGTGSKLNHTDLEKALKISVKTACEQEDGLFYRCQTDGFKGTAKFLNKFFTEKAIEELQKPLINEGLPDIEFLTKAFTQEARNHSEMQKINESCVKSWMEIFVSTYFENTNTYTRFQVAKENYLKQLANWFDDVKFAGIAVPGQEIEKSEKLAQIFVMPDVEEDLKRKDYPIIIDEITDIGIGKRQQELFLEQRQRALISRSGNKFIAEKLLTQSDYKKFVLLGAPGSGKTTLLSYFAVMLAQDQVEKLGLNPNVDYLPILIRMRDLSRLGEISILDYAKQFAENSMSVKNLPEGFFEYWLEDGRALILLDGLDEVAEESKRYKVVQRIENFLGQFQRNIAIITSRPAGYKRDFFRTEEFPHYELLAFDDEKVEEFVNRWYDSRFQDKAEAERRKEGLRKALNNNQRIKLLARNPLLLTIIALIHRYQAVLPKERHKLYDKAVETLITSWDANKELSNHENLQYLELDDLRRLMETLAYWIHTQGNTGDNEGGTLIDCDELLDQLKREIKLVKGIELYKAEEEAKRFIDLIKERTGLLNEQGHNCYAFVHKTFQEYLCAEQINYQADNEGDFEIILDYICEHLHKQHWREVLLLLVSQQKPKKAARAIRKILNNGSKYEQWLHRDLFFAADCLAEDVKGLSIADEKLGEEILRGLVDLEVSEEEKIGSKIRTQLFKIFCSFNETAFEEKALELLKAEADKIDRVRLQNYRAELGEKEEAIAIFIKLLTDDNNYMRLKAARVLIKLGKDSGLVVNALIELLANVDSLVRSSAAEVLGELSKDSDLVVNALIKLLANANKDSFVRSGATEALGELGNDSDTVVNTLVKLLDNDSSYVRSIAAQALGKLGKDSDLVVNSLIKLLDDEHSNVRSRAAEALGKLGKDSDLVVNSLVKLINDERSLVRSIAAQALGKLGKDSDLVVNSLIKLLDDEHSVRLSAAEALGKLGKDSDLVVNSVIELLDDEHSVRLSAAEVLVMLGKDSDLVVNSVIKVLDDNDLYGFWRSIAAQALGRLGKKSHKVTPLIEEWLIQNQDAENIGDAIDVLWDMVAAE
ncbi:NACHT domain-containing protein [Rivularia sp. UHCC 0363]|uniref:NACHT domain-containing protein n=1 Tax=Rivularia sp. UHCC 0363 TaxID=3110244 RepID=UPI002B1FF8B6|nr:HEAT repeat domain-containing protein [Rivularia sp. UHCC 0363]MEA5594451.1 HEAT repeat domain-containing protein [Rivularia sp. UHCC 0363]